MLQKISFDGLVCTGKVDQDIAPVLIFGKLLYHGRFANSASAFYKQSLLTTGFLFPCKKFIINLSPEKHIRSPLLLLYSRNQ